MFYNMICFNFLMFFMSYVVLIVNVLIAVAYLTLYERKILSYVQFRKGPNKLGLGGMIQPFSDGLKLFSKEYLMGFNMNYLIYLISPMFAFMLSLLIWVLFPYMFNMWQVDLGVLMMLSVFSVGVYFTIYSGWASNSLYGLLGALRAIAQSISYEVSLALILIIFVILSDSFNFVNIVIYQDCMSLGMCMIPLFFMFIISSLAELNRSPFDFVEGESELVSGFNIEYSSGMFAFLFLGEYAMILFFSGVWMFLFIGYLGFNMFSYFFILINYSLVILIRGTYPRFRYDKLMMLAWKMFLPFSLNYLIFILSIKIYVLFLLS
uniref:NADH-ubiquinone oxidoreductase chain 1 n=1 Tax=Janus compressus TaxID=1385266 RepID=A0A1W6Q5A9_9HYME|nr:NADH dehydrogenase subunit 1 [Janus compressus]